MNLFELGEKVRNARKALGMTQGALATKAGLSRGRLSQFESGACSDMNFNTVINVLNVLGMDLHIGDFNLGRPTYDDLKREQLEEYHRMSQEERPIAFSTCTPSQSMEM